MRNLGDTNRYGHMNRIAYMQDRQARLAQYSANRFAGPRFTGNNNGSNTTNFNEPEPATDPAANTETAEAQAEAAPVETVESVRNQASNSTKSDRQLLKEALSSEIEALTQELTSPRYIEEVIPGHPGSDAECHGEATAATPDTVRQVEVERDVKEDLKEALRVKDLVTTSTLSLPEQNKLTGDMLGVFQHLDSQVRLKIAELEQTKAAVGAGEDESDTEVEQRNDARRAEINVDLMDWMSQSQIIQRELQVMSFNSIISNVFGR